MNMIRNYRPFVERVSKKYLANRNLTLDDWQKEVHGKTPDHLDFFLGCIAMGIQAILLGPEEPDGKNHARVIWTCSKRGFNWKKSQLILVVCEDEWVPVRFISKKYVYFEKHKFLSGILYTARLMI